MADMDFDIRLKKEAAPGSLQEFRDQSLLRRKFGDEAVKLYNLIDAGKSASGLISALGMEEEKFVEILEFMNNNAIVSIVPSEAVVQQNWSKSSDGEDAPARKSHPAAANGERSLDGADGETSSPGGQIVQRGKSSAAPIYSKAYPAKEMNEDSLSPLEKVLYRKHGAIGVRIYNLIDGEKTAEEILRETGVSEAKLVEILEFMDEQGIIKLEKPEEKPAVESGAGRGASQGAKSFGGDFSGGDAGEEERTGGSDGGAGKEDSDGSDDGSGDAKDKGNFGGEDSGGGDGNDKGDSDGGDNDAGNAKDKGDGDSDGGEKSAREPRFKPIVEDVPEGKPFQPPAVPKKEEKPVKKEEIDEPGEDIVMVDVPVMAHLSMLQKALMFTELSTKFPPAARQLFDMADGKRDFVELSLAIGMPLFDIDSVMAYFGKKGFITFRQLDRNEIRDRFGEDGFAIYKRFGRDGLLIYEMIGKEASLRDIILKSKVEPDRAIDIFSFIHKVLGLDIPLDRDLIYRQIGLKK